MWWDAMRSPAARWNHPKAVEKTVPWKPWKTKPRFPTAPTAPWKTRNLGEFPTFPPPCDSLFPSLKKTKGQEGSMKQADRSSVNKSGQIQKLPTLATFIVGAHLVDVVGHRAALICAPTPFMCDGKFLSGRAERARV